MKKSLTLTVTLYSLLFVFCCKPKLSNKLKQEVVGMEQVSMENLNEENWGRYEMNIENLLLEFEKNKSEMSAEEIKEWHYWFGRHAALELKREFYPIRNQIDNILQMGEGFLEGLEGENIEKEKGLKDGLNLFDNSK